MAGRSVHPERAANRNTKLTLINRPKPTGALGERDTDRGVGGLQLVTEITGARF